MRRPIVIENIEELRRLEGIDDVDLRKEIRTLGIGELVKITLLTGPSSFECVLVKITSVRGQEFRGELVNSPTLPALSRLGGGSPVAFTAAHIHSVAKRTPARQHRLRGGAGRD
jgi:hypothetical protein